MTAVTALPYGRALTRIDLDLVLKHDRYRAAGCATYWVVDPHEPSIRAWRLEGTRFVEAGYTVGEDTLELDLPFPARIRPADLVR